MRLVKNYMKVDTLRHELNRLTRETFYFDFEDWVTNGYFEGDYIPYSLEEDGKILSNVSANYMHFVQNGKKKFYIQLGTVMTASDHRMQGLAKKLMEHVLETYEGKCDGIYLFANLSAVEFYKKLGFVEKTQHQYTLKDEVRIRLQREISEKKYGEGFVKVDSSDEGQKQKYRSTIRKSVPVGAFDQENKYGLQMFYTSGMENVYYSKELDLFAVYEKDGETLELQSVISEHPVSLERVIREIHADYKKLILGFTPDGKEADMFEASLYDGEDDYRLLCLGNELDSIEEEKLYFPTFSHA